MANAFDVGTSILYRANHFCRHFMATESWRQFGVAGARYGTSRARIAARAMQLYWAGRFLPEESLIKELVDPAVPLREHEQFLSEERLNGLQDSVNSPDSAMCRDKLLFHTYCHYHALPVTDLLGIVSSHGSRTRGGKPLVDEQDWVEFVRSGLPPTFIAKPRNGNKGRDIKLMGVEADPEAQDVLSLVKSLRALEQSEDHLLEARIKVHPAIVGLTGSSSASCVRVVTVIDASGIPKIMGAYHRLIVGDAVTDNITDFRTGRSDRNILASPNLETGVISSAWVANSDGIGRRPQQKHPDTGLDIVGFQIPMWGAVRDAVCTAATAFLPIRTIGWDVAISPEGPVLVEANERYQYAASDRTATQLRAALKNSLRPRD
jgi:hypothetical protein